MLVFTYIYVKQFSLIGGRRSRSGPLSIGTPRRRGKERPPQDIVSEESEETSSSDGEDRDYGQASHRFRMLQSPRKILHDQRGGQGHGHGITLMSGALTS